MNRLLVFMSKLLAYNNKFHQTMMDGGAGGGGSSSSLSGAEAEHAKKLQDISDKVKEILKGIAGPILVALGSIGVIYMIVLGVQYAKSEGDDKRAVVKRRLVNLAIGVVAIFALAALCLAVEWNVLIPQMFGYMHDAKV